MMDFSGFYKTNSATLNEHNTLHKTDRYCFILLRVLLHETWMTYAMWLLSDPSTVTPSFSQLRCGLGIPLARQSRVSFSPIGALTSEGCSESRMVGDTEWDKDDCYMPLKILPFMGEVYYFLGWLSLILKFSFLYPALWGRSFSVFVLRCFLPHMCTSQHETEWEAPAPACSLEWTTATVGCSLNNKHSSFQTWQMHTGPAPPSPPPSYR